MANPLAGFREFISAPGHKRTIGVLVILIIAAAVPLTVLVAQKQQETRQRAATSVITCSSNAVCSSTCSTTIYSVGDALCKAATGGVLNYCCPVGASTPAPTQSPSPSPTCQPVPCCYFTRPQCQLPYALERYCPIATIPPSYCPGGSTSPSPSASPVTSVSPSPSPSPATCNSSTPGAQCTACIAPQNYCGPAGIQTCTCGVYKNYQASCSTASSNCNTGYTCPGGQNNQQCVTEVVTPSPSPSGSASPSPTASSPTSPSPSGSASPTPSPSPTPTPSTNCTVLGDGTQDSCPSGYMCQPISCTASIPGSCHGTCILKPPQPGDTVLALNVGMDGVGSVGDNKNTTPPADWQQLVVKHQQRTVTIQLWDINNNEVVKDQSAQVNFNASLGIFTGSINLGSSLTGGNYVFKIKSDGHLRKSFKGLVNIVSGSKDKAFPQLNLVAGDIDGNNVIDIRDYNIFTSCSVFSSTGVDRSPNAVFDGGVLCNSNANYQTLSDLNDDGVIDQIDYNLFVREYSVQSGD